MKRIFESLITKPLLCTHRRSIYLNNPSTIRFFVHQNNEGRKSNNKRTVDGTSTLNNLLQHISDGNSFYLKKLSLHTIDFQQLKSDDAALLLQYSSSLPNYSCEQRNKVCQDIFVGLQNNMDIDINIYNTYIKSCNSNNYYLNYKDFISSLKCSANQDTYKLLLENVCQHGKVNDALSILEIMRNKNIPADLDVFNSLTLAHAMDGGLDLAGIVLKMMKLAYVKENNSTRIALLRGLIKAKNFENFVKAVVEYPLKLNELELLCIIEEMGMNGVDSWLSKINSWYKGLTLTREFQNELEKKCIHIIHMNHPESAMNLYKNFIPSSPEISYGYNLLKEMLLCNIDIKLIISLARDLVENNYNEYIFENITELSLKYGYVDKSLALISNFNNVRPHYFWPLFIHEGKANGEKGVFSILKSMKNLKVTPDAETLGTYVITYCDLTDVNLLVLKLQQYVDTVKEILSPLIMVLLKQKKTKKAFNICSSYKVAISGDELFGLLPSTWASTKDTISILYILKRYCESNLDKPDLVGRFLIDCLNLCRKDNNNSTDLIELTEKIGANRLKISTYSYNVLLDLCNNTFDGSLKQKFEGTINSLLDFQMRMEDETLTHPKNMDLEGLECHLIELQEKKMETRGVLRRLIQKHASNGNFKRVEELRQFFLNAGYEESAGIKSSIMYSFLLGGHVDAAIEIYKDLKASDAKFSIDSFKFIDLARHLIIHNRFQEAFDILQTETAYKQGFGNTQSIVRNCKELLSSCKSAEHAEKMFNLLIKSRLCKPTNVILGPLVKIHLNRGELNEAVNKYIELSQKYNCTPLQLEILCLVAKQEDTILLQKVIKATESVHGVGPTHVGLIAALAENGQEKSLRKTLMITTVPIKPLLEKRCERWVKENKVDALKCLLKASDKLPEKTVDVQFVCQCILEYYDVKGDYNGAVTFYESIPDEFSCKYSLTDNMSKLRLKYATNIDRNLEI